MVEQAWGQNCTFVFHKSKFSNVLNTITNRDYQDLWTYVDSTELVLILDIKPIHGSTSPVRSGWASWWLGNGWVTLDHFGWWAGDGLHPSYAEAWSRMAKQRIKNGANAITWSRLSKCLELADHWNDCPHVQNMQLSAPPFLQKLALALCVWSIFGPAQPKCFWLKTSHPIAFLKSILNIPLYGFHPSTSSFSNRHIFTQPGFHLLLQYALCCSFACGGSYIPLQASSSVTLNHW